MANPDAQPNTTDQFITDNLPAWLHAASAQQIAALQVRFAAHRATEAKLHDALKQLKTPQDYARTLLNQAIKAKLKLDFDLVNALWRQHWDKYSLLGGESFVNHYTIEPALHHLLQNFPSGMYFDSKTGLIAAGHDAFLTSKNLLVESSRFVAVCREVDAGKRYQGHLDQVFDAAFKETLVVEKRQRLALSVDLAHVKMTLSDADLAVLSPLIDGAAEPHVGTTLKIEHLQLLGCALLGALTVQLPAIEPAGGEPSGIVLYLPHRPLQRFDSLAGLSAYLLTLMQAPHEQEQLLALVSLKQRAMFQSTLSKRLSDPQPDLEVTGTTAAKSLFTELASLQLQRIREDARFLLVPVADVDDQVKWQRLQTLESVGMN